MGRSTLEIEHRDFACPVLGQAVTIRMSFKSRLLGRGDVGDRVFFGGDCLSRLNCSAVMVPRPTGGAGISPDWSKCACPSLNRAVG